MRDSRPILLVEDDTVDAMTVNRALKEINVSNPVVHVKNGEEAIAHLKDPSTEDPCIILLDLNMPKMNGLEFLEERNQYDEMRIIPTIVLTTSKDEYDKIESFKLGIGGYMVKPVDYRQFVEVVRTIDMYWTLSEAVD